MVPSIDPPVTAAHFVVLDLNLIGSLFRASACIITLLPFSLIVTGLETHLDLQSSYPFIARVPEDDRQRWWKEYSDSCADDPGVGVWQSDCCGGYLMVEDTLVDGMFIWGQR
jgi:hypothetical protein